MNAKELLSKDITKKIIAVVLLLAIALLSFFVISKPATDAQTYAATIQSIDEKKSTVMGLTASAAAVSSALAAIPGDTTTPVANQIMEISAYLLIVVCVLVLEKSLLTTMGFISFNILIPAACALFGIYVFCKKHFLKMLAIKILAFALVLVTIIPLSLKISDLIYESQQDTITQVMEETEEVPTQEQQPEEEKSFWDTIKGAVDGAVETITATAEELQETAKKALNSFIDAIALFLIAYCAIPVVVVLVVVWFFKFLFGIQPPMPTTKKEEEKNTFPTYQES